MEDYNKYLNGLIDYDSIEKVETIQSLWAGYGELIRVYLKGSAHPSIVVKLIEPPSLEMVQSKGQDSIFAHERKVKSYLVESIWYYLYAYQLNGFCKMPTLLGQQKIDGKTVLALEDLKTAGFTQIKTDLNDKEIKACINWLAHFHAFFLKDEAVDLWDTGTYWHLSTRPDEFAEMKNAALKAKAVRIDEQLNAAKYKTFVHGDAKYANFLFSETGEVAAVDFQYVGGGCGMKDLVYLLSCLGEKMNESLEQNYLAYYFKQLNEACVKCYHAIDLEALEKEWRRLYVFAWADFERFLNGWSPGHWKSSAYAQKQVDKTLDILR